MDSFQGKESSIVILDMVNVYRSSTQIGFLRDDHRINVALTRARDALFVIANYSAMRQCTDMVGLRYLLERIRVYAGESRHRIIDDHTTAHEGMALLQGGSKGVARDRSDRRVSKPRSAGLARGSVESVATLHYEDTDEDEMDVRPVVRMPGSDTREVMHEDLNIDYSG